MSRIIITGSSGYLGTHLCNSLRHETEKIFALYNSNQPEIENIEKIKIDLLQTDELNLLFKDIKPDYVIHLAAVTPSKSFEVDEKYIYSVNVDLTGKIASLCHFFNSYLIFTSTDLVYAEGENIKEDHELNPLNLYARTKLEAEKVVHRYAKYFLILRTSLMYGFSISKHKSFFDYSFIKLLNGETVKAFYNQFRNSLFVEEAAKFINQFLNLKLPDNSVMNFCGFENLSRFEMLYKTAEIFDLNKDLILKESCENFKEYKMAKRLHLNFDRMKSFNLLPKTFEENLLYLKSNFDRYKPYIIKYQQNEF